MYPGGAEHQAFIGVHLVLIGATQASYVDRKLFGNAPQSVAADAPVPTLIVQRHAGGVKTVLRRADARWAVLRGTNLATNLEFHYGLVNWFLGQNVMAKPTTRFVVPYLTLVGKLKEEASKLDVVFAFLAMKKHFGQVYGDDPEIRAAISETLDRKGTLLTRPMDFLLADPHLLAGWLSINRKNFKFENGKLIWLRNPLVILEETYEYLNMTWREDAPAAEVIWTHDRDLLQNALEFYAELRSKFGLEKDEFLKLNQILGKATPQGGYDKETWAKIQAAHLGYEVGVHAPGRTGSAASAPMGRSRTPDRQICW